MIHDHTHVPRHDGVVIFNNKMLNDTEIHWE
jgi:hypothetical protein